MRKTTNCTTCGPEAIYDATTSEDGTPVWECRCCGGQIKRRVLNTKSKQVRAAKNKVFTKLIEELTRGV